jgi:hypothetical protein
MSDLVSERKDYFGPEQAQKFADPTRTVWSINFPVVIQCFDIFVLPVPVL